MSADNLLRRPPDPRDRLTREMLLHPGPEDRPGIRWWWQSPVSPDELIRELHAIRDAGFGEVEIAFSPGFWGDIAQRHALGVILDEARKLGVGVASTLGAAWPLQTPNTGRGTENASKELQYGVVYLAGGEPRDVDLPRPFDDPSGIRGGEIVAVTLARVRRRGPGPRIRVVQDPWRGDVPEITPPSEPTILDHNSLKNVTADITDGVFTWGGGDGEWALFAMWMRDTDQGVTSFLDRRAAQAATEYIDVHQIGTENVAKLAEAGTDLFEDSLELNADSLFWSPDLLDRFRARRGYDIVAYLPLLFAHGMCRYWVPNDDPVPDFDTDNGSGTRIRRDYYRLITDLYVDDHLLVLQEWAIGHGLRHKAQVAYGQNLEPVRSNREFVRNGGRAEGESLNSGDRAPVLRDHPNWRFSLDWQRAIVGGAHQGGSTRISTELGAQFGAAYALTLGVLKQMLDKEWAAGITRPFVHGYASQSADATWPTESRFFDYVADSWNDRHFPEWKHWQPLTDYWSRGTMILETGVPRTDIAIYREGFLTTAARGTPEQDATAPARLVDAEPLERSGYTVQFIDPLGLEDASPAIHAGRLFPEGPGYRAVILDEREIDLSTAQALDTAASRGLAVLFVGEMPALAAPPGGIVGDPRQERVIQDLLRHPNALRVPDVQSVPAALDSLGVRPQVAFDGDPVLTQWRETSRNSYLLVYNTEHRTICTDLDVEGHWEANEIDLWSADIRAASLSTVDGGTTRMSVDLGPLELRVFELRRAARGMLLEPRIENDSFEVVDLNSAWSLEVTTEEASGARIIHLDGQGPRDWRDIAELCDVSGTGIYRIPVGCVSGAYVAVELGELAGSATVRVDGRPYGTVYVSGGSVNVGAALAEGGLLEIEVRTPLRNAVAAVGTRL